MKNRMAGKAGPNLSVTETADDGCKAEVSQSQIVEKYRRNYGIKKSVVLTYNMVQFHWDLERQLTKKILGSNPSERWQVTEECYTELYESIPWVQEVEPAPVSSLEDRFRSWEVLLSPPPKRIYEVGSGQGELTQYLASLGHFCKGSEITRERGEKWATESPNIVWGSSDGVHLSDFEGEEVFDAVISDQVVEHIHPEDIQEHFNHAWQILNNGGIYVFRTPHRFFGPADISLVFDCDVAHGMHLREYTFCELYRIMRHAGFSYVELPGRSLFKMCLLERLFGKDFPKKNLRKRILRKLCFPSGIFMLGVKSQQINLSRRIMEKGLYLNPQIV